MSGLTHGQHDDTRMKLISARGIALADDVSAQHNPHITIPLPPEDDCGVLPGMLSALPLDFVWYRSPTVLPALWEWLCSSKWCRTSSKNADTPWYVALLSFEASQQGYWPTTTSPLQATSPSYLTIRCRSFGMACMYLLETQSIKFTSRERTLRGRSWGCPPRAGVREFLWIPQPNPLARAVAELQAYNDHHQLLKQQRRIGPTHQGRMPASWGSDIVIREHVMDGLGDDALARTRFSWPRPKLHKSVHRKIELAAMTGLASIAPSMLVCDSHKQPKCLRCASTADGVLAECCILHHHNIPELPPPAALNAVRDFLSGHCVRARTRGMSTARFLIHLTQWMRSEKRLSKCGSVYVNIGAFEQIISSDLFTSVLGRKAQRVRVLSDQEKALRRAYAARRRGRAHSAPSRSKPSQPVRRNSSGGHIGAPVWIHTGSDGTTYIGVSIRDTAYWSTLQQNRRQVGSESPIT